jgi:hypothetical protein
MHFICDIADVTAGLRAGPNPLANGTGSRGSLLGDLFSHSTITVHEFRVVVTQRPLADTPTVCL